jgi:hypothetical protein
MQSVAYSHRASREVSRTPLYGRGVARSGRRVWQRRFWPEAAISRFARDIFRGPRIRPTCHVSTDYTTCLDVKTRDYRR